MSGTRGSGTAVLVRDHDARFAQFLERKGIDVWLSLEAYDLAVHKRFDVLVLVSGDGDFVPLVRKINGIGTRVMLIGVEAEWEYNGKEYGLHVAQRLIDEASYPILLNSELDAKTAKGERLLDGLFRP